MKKLFALFLAVAMVVSLVACNKNAPDEPKVSGTPDSTVIVAPTDPPGIQVGESVEAAQERIYQDGLKWLQTEAKLDLNDVTSFDFQRVADIYNAASQYWTTPEEDRTVYQAVREMVSLGSEGSTGEDFLGHNIGIIPVEEYRNDIGSLTRGYTFHVGHTNGKAYYIDADDGDYNPHYVSQEAQERIQKVTDAVWGLFVDGQYRKENDSPYTDNKYDVTLDGDEWTLNVRSNSVWAMRKNQDDRWDVDTLKADYLAAKDEVMSYFDSSLLGPSALKYDLLLTDTDMKQFLNDMGYTSSSLFMSMQDRVVRKTYVGDAVNYRIEASAYGCEGDIRYPLPWNNLTSSSKLSDACVNPYIDVSFGFTVMPDGSYADVHIMQKVFLDADMKQKLTGNDLPDVFKEANATTHKLCDTMGIILTSDELDNPILETDEYDGGERYYSNADFGFDVSSFLVGNDAISFNNTRHDEDNEFLNTISAWTRYYENGNGVVDSQIEINIYSDDMMPDEHTIEYYLAK